MTIKTEKLEDGTYRAYSETFKNAEGRAADARQAVNEFKRAAADAEAKGSQNWSK